MKRIRYALLAIALVGFPHGVLADDAPLEDMDIEIATPDGGTLRVWIGAGYFNAPVAAPGPRPVGLRLR